MSRQEACHVMQAGHVVTPLAYFVMPMTCYFTINKGDYADLCG